jgi:hypothetical protein
MVISVQLHYLLLILKLSTVELFHKVISGCQKVRGDKCSLKLEVVVLVAGRTQHIQECNDQGSENPPMYSGPLLDLRSTGEFFSYTNQNNMILLT